MRFTNPLGPTVLAPTTEVTLAAGTKVELATGAIVTLTAGTKVGVTGDVTLAAGTEVKLTTGSVVTLPAGTEVGVVGASSSGQTAPAFAGRTVSASSSAYLHVTATAVWETIISSPGSGKYLELHGLEITALSTGAGTIYLGDSGSGTTKIAAFYVAYKSLCIFNFEGATLSASSALWVKNESNVAVNVQVNYTVIS